MLFVTDLFLLLNEKYNYAVLRNFDGLPHAFKSHDIDLIIEEKSLPNLKIDVLELIDRHQLKILMINRNERFLTFILAKYEDNHLEYLYLDLFFNYSLYGVLFFDAETILERKIFNGQVYHVSQVDEYLEKYLNTKLLNQPYPDKYKAIQQRVETEHKYELDQNLYSIFSPRKNEFLVKNHAAKALLLMALINSIKKNPFRQIVFGARFTYFFIKNLIFPNGFSFSISGPDGSGKTTILRELEHSFSPIYRELGKYHFRPNLVPRLAELFNKTGLKKEVDVDYHLPHRGTKTGTVSSAIRLVYYIADYIIGYSRVVRPILYRRGMVIFDRYYTDIISDSLRSRINLNFKIIFFLRRFVPGLRYNFIIYVDPDIILKRKQEITAEKIIEINSRLKYISEHDSSYYLIGNNGSAVEAVSEIVSIILENQHRSYITFFK